MNIFWWYVKRVKTVSKKITHVESLISTAISFDSKFIRGRLFQFLLSDEIMVLKKNALKQEEYYYKIF